MLAKSVLIEHREGVEGKSEFIEYPPGGFNILNLQQTVFLPVVADLEQSIIAEDGEDLANCPLLDRIDLLILVVGGLLILLVLPPGVVVLPRHQEPGLGHPLIEPLLTAIEILNPNLRLRGRWAELQNLHRLGRLA